MKKRFIVLLAVLLVLTCALVGTVAASEASLPETCPQCGEAVTWTGISTVVADDATTIDAGHYYLDYAEDAHSWSAEKTVSGKVCLYMNGKTLQSTARVFSVKSGGVLSISGEGTLCGSGAEITTGTPTFDGGTIYVYAGGMLNLRDATLTHSMPTGGQVNNGGIVYLAGTFTMHSGNVNGGCAYAGGGNLYLSGRSATFNMKGGTIANGTATRKTYGAGGNIYINTNANASFSGGSVTGGTAPASPCVNNRSVVTLSGSASIERLRQSPTSNATSIAGMLKISGKYTGSVNLNIQDKYLVKDTVIGSAADNANVIGATINITDISNKVQPLYLAVDSETLVLTDGIEHCDHCNEDVVWSWLTEKDAAATKIAAGHYRVHFENGTCDWAQKTISGKVCLDMNGMNIQGIKRVFLVESGAELTVMGGGTITGGGFASDSTNAQRYGGVAYIYAGGKMNVYGGTYKTKLYESTNKKPYQGGSFWVQGELNLHNATVGGEASQAGHSIFIQSGSKNGKVTVDGGSITTQIWAKGYLTLANRPSISKTIVLKNPYLRVEGALSGEITVNYENAAAGMVIGTCEDMNIRFADFYVVSPMLYISEQDGNLVLNKFPTIFPYRMEKRYCQACDKECDFAELTDEYIYAGELTTGHYFLNLTDPSVKFDPYTILGRDRVCLDLNGQNWICDDLAFDLRSNTIFNVMDSVGGGSIVGSGPKSVDTPYGGTIMVRGLATLNLHSGTLSYAAPTDGRSAISRGGVVYALGNVNVYGGTVTGGQATAGGNIYIDADKDYVGHIGLYGGTVTNGTATNGGCIISRGTVLLSGNPEIYQVRRTVSSYSPDQGDMLEIQDDFTGSVQLFVSSWSNGMDIGHAANADISGATITFNDSAVDRLLIQNGEIYAVNGEPVAIVHKADGSTAAYTDAAAAIAASDNAETIVLTADFADLELTKDLTIDLNGFNITGAITGTGKLTLLDSKTDDFDITDGAYGKIPAASKAFVQAAEGYLMAEEEDGLSFHRIVLNISGMSLKSKSVGLYFISEFKGDRLVKEQIKNFGVMLSVDGDPVDVMETGIVRSTQFGKEAFNLGTPQTSSLVIGIMKDANGNDKNQQYAAMQIYGRPYVTLVDGTVLYGTCRNRSLREQVEAADASWATLTISQKAAFVEMYNAFSSVIAAEGSAWSTANTAGRSSKAEQFNTTDYSPYLAPWKENVVEKAIADGKIHYYFMAGEGLFISSGQTYKDKWGDACLIVFPNGQTMLVDAGPLSYAPVLLQNLENMGITHLDYFLLTHPHSDHQNGIFYDSAVIGSGLLDKISIGQIYYRGGYDCDYDYETGKTTLALQMANQYGIPIQPIEKGDVFNFGDVRMEVVWPLAGDGDNLISGGEEINSMSITMRFDYGEHSSLFTGDLYVSGEMNILKKVDHDLLKADFLKVPHHGYATSSCPAFLNAVDPDLAVSTGRLPIPQRIYDRYEDLEIELLDDRQKGYIHVTGAYDGELLYETTREAFVGEDTTPSDPDVDPAPDGDED